jgi:hypothetical protein
MGLTGSDTQIKSRGKVHAQAGVIMRYICYSYTSSAVYQFLPLCAASLAASPTHVSVRHGHYTPYM